MRMREAARCLAALVLACGVTVAVAGEFMLATPEGSLPRAVTNEWNAAGSWTGGAVPTAGDVVRSGGMLTTDRLWVMEGTATLGSLADLRRFVPTGRYDALGYP